MPLDIVELLRIDPGRRTLGELFQERDAALHEIVSLRRSVERLQSAHDLRTQRTQRGADESRPLLRTGTLLRLAEVCEIVGVGRSTVYKWLADGIFPAPIRISTRAIRWSADAIADWRDGLVTRAR